MPRSLLVSTLLLFTCSTLFAEQNVEETNVIEPNPDQEIIEQGSEIHAQITQMIKEVEQLEIQVERTDGDIQAAFELEKQQKTILMLELLFDLTNVLHEQGKLGIENPELRDVVVSYIIRTSNGVDDILETVLGMHNDKRSTSVTLTGYKLIEFERSIAYDLDWIEELFDIKSKTVQEMERLGLSSENHRENFVNRLTPFAENLAGQIRLVEKEKEAIEETASGEPLSSDLGLQLRALQIRNEAIVSTLSTIVRHLDKNGIDSTRYRQLMLQTGAVSTDLFNPRVMIGLIRNQLLDALEWVKDNAGSFVANAFIFLAILFVFNIFAKLSKYLMQRSFDTKKVETSRLMQEMLLSLSSRGIMLLGILFALGQLGIEITALLTGSGVM